MRRKDRALTEERAREILEQVSFATLMTADESGQPYGVPINPFVDENCVYFHCATEGRKLDNIKSNPKVSLSAVFQEKVIKEKYSVHYESIYIEGKAFFVEDMEEKVRILKVLCNRYISKDETAHVEYMKPHLAHTTICGIAIDHISGKGNLPKK
ncbi:pyridoxamine 5'-phosphate oxidase family protein [Chakrabartyella piscis]|uniref:pyridoxamine 5'-phosphate oxidase family protein n=1 Tax=Chakrabartyella piscis TaxID=2918914 RepID=UPI002958A640|nr:pyridoxamine 5'-phosphate oxidase family protein [Chakrabartyella piscis]